MQYQNHVSMMMILNVMTPEYAWEHMKGVIHIRNVEIYMDQHQIMMSKTVVWYVCNDRY